MIIDNLEKEQKRTKENNLFIVDFFVRFRVKYAKLFIICYSS